MSNQTSIFNVGLLDDLHKYFPDLLYNSSRFHTVQDVLLYVQEQAKSRFNLFDYGARQYAQGTTAATTVTATTATGNVVIQPSNQPTGRCTCPTCMPPVINTPQRPVPVLTTTQPPPMNPRIRPRTHYSPITAFYSLESELLEPPPSTTELSAMNSLLSLFSLPMGQTLYNAMENVIVRPTQDQITNATSILTLTDTSDITCTVCQEPIEPDVPVRRINQCEHQFHKACIDRWFERSVFCPMCRLDIRDIHSGIGGTGGTGGTGSTQ
jgi:hypothetical protein